MLASTMPSRDVIRRIQIVNQKLDTQGGEELMLE